MVKLKNHPPLEFLNAENREGCFVSQKKKEAWAVEIDLAQELLRVCKKHNLKVFADMGTLLGAVRHKGFIPWDDDMDFSMLREDYEKLCLIAPDEFKHPYFFQYSNTGTDFVNGHAKLRNSETTGIVKNELARHLSYNQGIFIDVFPLDGVFDNNLVCFCQMHLAQVLRLSMLTFAYFSSRYFESSNVFLRLPKKIVYLLFNGIFRKCQKISYKMMMFVSLCNRTKNKKYVSGLTYSDALKKQLRKNYEVEEFARFEYVTIPIMRGYNDVLTKWYGDWHTPRMCGGAHGELLFDTNRSYQEYLNEKI